MLIAVHVTPRSGRDVVLGLQTTEGKQEVHVRVTAPPDGGKANAAVCKMIAKQIGVAKGKVSVKRGDASRHKMLEIDCPNTVVNEWLSSLSVID